MGSWNKTCGLSNLHITAGTPVYVFILEESRGSSNCYSTSLFAPLLLPFESEYNDYGAGQNSSGVALPMILESIKHNLVEMPLGENTYHDIEISKEKFDERLFFEAVHEQRLQVSRFGRGTSNVQFTMFRKDIVDAILEKRNIDQYVGDGKGNFSLWGNSKDYIRYNFKDIVADIKPMFELALAILAKAKAENDPRADYMLYDGIDGLFDARSENKVVQWMWHDSHRYSRIVDMKTVIREGLVAGTPEALDKLAEVLEVHLKGLFIDNFMDAARKTWIPGGYEGSQSSSGAALRMLAGITLNILDKEKEEWLAENDIEEEYIEE